MYERPIDVDHKPRILLVTVPSRDAKTLLNVIYKHILPGTIIYSDCWSSYNRVKELHFEHLTVNHSLNFKNPQNGAHTNGIESTWNSAKIHFKAMRGANRKYLATYLNEFMWRKNNCSSRYQAGEKILEEIGKIFPANENASIDGLVSDLENISIESIFEEEEVVGVGKYKGELPDTVELPLDENFCEFETFEEDSIVVNYIR